MKYLQLICFFVLYVSYNPVLSQSISITPSTTGTLKAGDIISYRVTATNNTSTKISNAVINNTLPLSPYLLVPNSLIVSGTSLTCSVPTTVSETIQISGFDLLPDEEIYFEYRMLVSDPFPFPGTGTLTNTATFGSASATVNNVVSAIPNLTITATSLPLHNDSISKGGVITYTFQITNTGSATASNVFFIDTFDIHTRLLMRSNVSVDINYIGSYTILSGNDTLHTRVNVSLGDIPVGGTATISFAVRGRTSGANATTAGMLLANRGRATQDNYPAVVSSMINHIVLVAANSCKYRDVYYIGPNGNNTTAEVNNPSRPFQTLSGVVSLINSAGGNAYVSFIEHYYTCSTLGTGTLPVLTKNCVTIDGNNSIIENTATFGGLIGVSGGHNDTIKDFTIYRGNVSGSHTIEAIGASQGNPITGFHMSNVKVLSGVSVVQTLFQYIRGTIDNCEWSGNTFGAIDIRDGIDLKFNSCKFYCNERNGNGGAIDIRAANGLVTTADAPFTNITFNGGEFNGNKSTSTGQDGGGMYFGIGRLTINGTVFNNNTSAANTGTAGGGAIRIDVQSATSGTPIVNIKDAVFIGNKAAAGNGGAININTRGRVTISGSQFISDTASSGGAIYSRQDSLYISNCYFTKNRNSAIVNDGTSPPIVTFIDSTTITGNSTSTTGAGLTGSITRLTNSVICSNVNNSNVQTNLTVKPLSVTNSLYGSSGEAINNTTLTVYYNGDSSLTVPSGWTFVNTTSTAIQQAGTGDGGTAGYWLLEYRDTATSPNINLTGWTNVTVQFRAATYGTTGAPIQVPTFDYSLDGGSTWTPVTPTTTPTTSTTYVNVLAPLNLGSPNISNFRMRFSQATNLPALRGVRVDNMIVSADNPISCPASNTLGNNTNLSISTIPVFNPLTSCPATPTATSGCPDFNNVGKLALTSCKFLNSYTGDFSAATPFLLDAKTLIVRVYNFDSISSPANFYKYKFLVTDAAGVIKQIINPTRRNNVPDSTFYTPSSAIDAAGDYFIYGYYHDTTQAAGVPSVGSNISTLPGSGCGKLSTPTKFVVLNPIVETVSSHCSYDDMEACKNRYIATVSVTGGYPKYAADNGLAIPYYTISVDTSYVPTTFNHKFTSWMSYGLSSRYITTYQSGRGFGVKTTNDRSCYTYPYTLDVAAYTIPSSCQIAINGNTYHDPNGNTDNTINGSLSGNPASTTLYAYLYYTAIGGDNILLDSQTISTGGIFSFGENFAPNNDYKIAFTSTPIVGAAVGNPLPAITLPTNWVNTGDGYNAVVDATPNQLTDIIVADTDFNIIKFGFQQRPFALKDTGTLETNPGSTTFLPLDMTLFKKTDYDGSVTTVTLTDFPSTVDAFTVDDTTYYATTLPGTCPTAYCKLFPAAGIPIPVDGAGNVLATITYDPQDAIQSVMFEFITTDNALSNSLAKGYALVPFDAIILPVTWLSFVGHEKTDYNHLIWKTTGEKGIDKYEVEKSTDAIHFSKIGETAAAGEVYTVNNYAFEDYDLSHSTLYYRIKSVGTDSDYSHIISLSNAANATVKVYPNPVKEVVFVSFYDGADGSVSATITDDTGRKMLSKEIATKSGINIIPLPVTNLADGVYVLQLKTAQDTKFFKITVQK